MTATHSWTLHCSMLTPALTMLFCLMASLAITMFQCLTTSQALMLLSFSDFICQILYAAFDLPDEMGSSDHSGTSTLRRSWLDHSSFHSRCMRRGPHHVHEFVLRFHLGAQHLGGPWGPWATRPTVPDMGAQAGADGGCKVPPGLGRRKLEIVGYLC